MRTAILLLTALPAFAANSATFISTDTTSLGVWKGTYGAGGYNIPGGPLQYPGYVTVATSGINEFTYAQSSSDANAPQNPDPGSTDRIKAVYYSTTNFTVELTFSGGTHRASFYSCACGGTGDAFSITVKDGDTNATLDTQTVSSQGSGTGRYFTWDFTGHIKLTYTKTGGTNALLSGMFFAEASGSANSAAITTYDTTTKGSWKGVYGQGGYNLANFAYSYPPYVTAASISGGTPFTGTGTDTNSPYEPNPFTAQLKSVWYSATSWTLTLTLNGAHSVGFYFILPDSVNRTETFAISDADTSAPLYSRSVVMTTPSQGFWVIFSLSGHVTMTFTKVSGSDADLAMIAFNDAAPCVSTGGQVANCSGAFPQTTATGAYPSKLAANQWSDYGGYSFWTSTSCFRPDHATISGGYLSLASTQASAASLSGYVCMDHNADGTVRNGPYLKAAAGAQISTTAFSFTYGTVEFSAKFPTGTGSWPAVWLLGANCQKNYAYYSPDNIGTCNWQQAGSDEIDIAEGFQHSPQMNINQQIHSGSNNPGCTINESSTPSIADPTAAYHTYQLVWSAGSAVWKIDGVTTCTQTGAAVPSTPMFLILDNASTGGTGGTFSIDYIKVTQGATVVFDEEFN